MTIKNIVFILLLAILCTLAVISVVRYLPMPGIPTKEETQSSQDPLMDLSNPTDHATPSQDIGILTTQEMAQADLPTTTSVIDSIKEITNAEYLQDILNNKGPLVLKFYAPWCGACKTSQVTYPEIAQHFGDAVTFYAIDITNQELMNKLEAAGFTKEPVSAIPSFIYKHSEKNVHEQSKGLMSPSAMKEYIKKTFEL